MSKRYQAGMTIRTKREDFDDDDGVKRRVPVGMTGTLGEFHDGQFDVLWENGAWTMWEPGELDQDADVVDLEGDDIDAPEIHDEVLCCPDCETPNQFGELCSRCIADREQEGGGAA